LGLGVALAWAALPLLLRLALRSRAAPPAEYYRALVTALGIAAALILLPLVRSWSGSTISLITLTADGDGSESSTVTFVAELVTPLIGSAANAWPSLALAQLFAAIGGIWLLLLAAGVSASIKGHLRLHRVYGEAAAAPERVLARAQRLAAELGVRAPPIRVADGPAEAFSFGAFTPVIVLSTSACDMESEDLDFVLRHELCHIARHDTRTMCVIDLVQRCFAGHPSLRALASEIRVAREARADEAAAGARSLEYARFLLSLAEHIHAVREPSASLVSMADTALERRVDMLINPSPKRPRLRRSILWLALAGLGLSGLLFATPASFGQPEQKASDHLTVRGDLSVEQVEKALFTQAQPMLDCYSKLPPPRANLPMHISFVIDESGRVESGRVSAPDQPQLEPCLHAGLMQNLFPRPTGGTVSVEGDTLLSAPYHERRAVLESSQGTSTRLPAEVIRSTVRSHYPQLRACFERLSGALPTVNVSMNFIIGRDGHAIDGETTDKSEQPTNNEAFTKLAQCVDDVRKTLQFPAPGDGIVSVNYPLVFEDTASGED